MAAGSANSREAQERLRRYQARQTVHETATARRKRDNLVAVVALVVVAALATTAQIVYFTSGPGAPEPVASATPVPSETPATAPDAALSEFRTWTGTMTINESIALDYELDGLAAPQAVASFVSLVQDGFYDGLTCHRLTTQGIFVLQCGDPNGDGTGGPDYRFGPIENSPLDDVYATGVIAMARQSGDGSSMGSQFFIVYDESTIPSDAAGGYTVIGRVTAGLDALVSEVIAAGVDGGAPDGPPAVATTITGITIE
ncbi:peptidylprolyl isomerase [Microcella frigidaquae]|uniref:peptidylprolyl isomerase n=1 Tax=Microcella frigidaquae TaxID=424758 RepID=A0A840XEA5_9MICO|nr:peptidyl-prolyl cis-trans isomerase B (cyclophilin B) [Microcella frigidaquae]NHN43902.1 peptidylprolyl isomerase [Microcella frigidaquae]